MSSKKDFITQSYTKPLVLVPDTSVQRTPFFKGKTYPAPCPVSKEAYAITASVIPLLAVRAQFEFTGHPAYHLFDNELFHDQRVRFWKPILRLKFPIYIVSSLLGVVWPGEPIGLYALAMEESFVLWRQSQLWRCLLELFDANECDCVVSYLPPVYDNVVRIEDTPWYVFKPEELIKHQRVLLKLANNLANPRNIPTNLSRPIQSHYPAGKGG